MHIEVVVGLLLLHIHYMCWYKIRSSPRSGKETFLLLDWVSPLSTRIKVK